MLTSKKACERLGIHPNTLRKWADDEKIDHIRTPHGQRLYDVDGFLSRTGTRARIVYCRISSRNQRNDFRSQIEFMRVRFPNHEPIEDLGSGLNFKRKGFNSLLERILSGIVEEVVVAHKDPGGYTLLKEIFKVHLLTFVSRKVAVSNAFTSRNC